MRCAASLAFCAVSWVSSGRSFSLAPPSDLMPPDLLTSSTAISAPSRSRMPSRAQGAGERHQHGEFELVRCLCPRRQCSRAAQRLGGAAPDSLCHVIFLAPVRVSLTVAQDAPCARTIGPSRPARRSLPRTIDGRASERKIGMLDTRLPLVQLTIVVTLQPLRVRNALHPLLQRLRHLLRHCGRRAERSFAASARCMGSGTSWKPRYSST